MTTYRIVDRYSHLNDTDAGRAALSEYEGALARGLDDDQAEVIASNALQSAGYNVNHTGGVSIESAGHRVEIACDATEAQQFCEWLNANGHDAKIGTSTGGYIDGVRTSDPEASETMNALWTAYCNG
jgi:hypothetical protein